MQASVNANKLRDTFRHLHAGVFSALRIGGPSQSIRSLKCCSSTAVSSSSSHQGLWRRAQQISNHYAVFIRCRSSGTRQQATDDADAASPLEPALYVVGTPIGNLEDISFRAIRILQRVNLILAEDTRHTRKLLEHFAIRTPTLSCHEHNERQRQDLVLQRLTQGEPIALVSDAGMPAISDPGAVIVAAAVAAGVRVVPVPGPCAAVAALAGAGLPTDTFYFAGFLPPKSGRRKAVLQELRGLSATLVFYAPPHGLAAVLSDLYDVLGPHRQAVVARELTKLHEEFFRGTIATVLEEFGPGGRREVRGEVVLLVSGCSPEEQQQMMLRAAATSSGAAAAATPDSDEDVLRQLIQRELDSQKSVSATAKALSLQLKVPRSKIYKLALEVAQDTSHTQQQ